MKLPQILTNDKFFPRFLELAPKYPVIKDLYKILTEEGCTLSYQTIKDGYNYIKTMEQSEINTAIEENKKVSIRTIQAIKAQGPKLGSIVERRRDILSFYTQRREELLRYVNLPTSYSNLQQNFFELEALVQDLNKKLDTKSKEEFSEQLNKKFKCIEDILKEFPTGEANLAAEAHIREYTKLIDEVYRYLEAWVSKYDVYNILEDISYSFMEASAESFAPYLKVEPEKLKEIVETYKSKCKMILEQVIKNKVEITK